MPGTKLRKNTGPGIDGVSEMKSITPAALPGELTDPLRPANLVTGSLGFVGRYLVRSLVLAGLPVVGFDLGGLHATPPERVGEFKLVGAEKASLPLHRYEGPAGCFFQVTGNLTNQELLGSLLGRLRPTMVFHLAAQSSAAQSFRDPVGTLAGNLQGTVTLFEAIRALPQGAWPIILSVGSCEEYGPQPEDAYPLTESTSLNPLSPYAVSKVAQTLLGQQYFRAWDLPIIPVRAFSHTGPGQDKRFAFPAFAHQIARAEAGLAPPVILTGDLSSVRDFLHVRDVVDAYRLLMKEGIPGRIYNVCSGQPLTMRQGLDIMAAEARCDLEIRTDEARLRPADTPYMVGDNSLLVSDTGWAQEWDISQTLGALLDEARKEFS
jgi:GDP-4-dehydro-6-deoxy-D-mannose reductase